jgi:hypothetical protein
VLNSLSALPDSSDETIGAAADAAYMAARYRASQGSYAAASLREIAERLVISTGKKKGQHPSAATVMRMLRDHDEMSATGVDQAWATLRRGRCRKRIASTRRT